jgi:hypothetical protein
MDILYNVYGGMQDSVTERTGLMYGAIQGIKQLLARNQFFGDGFDVIPPDDSRYGWSMSRQGWLCVTIGKRETTTGASTHQIQMSVYILIGILQSILILLIIVPYTLIEFVHKSTDKVETWTVISTG